MVSISLATTICGMPEAMGVNPIPVFISGPRVRPRVLALILSAILCQVFVPSVFAGRPYHIVGGKRPKNPTMRTKSNWKPKPNKIPKANYKTVTGNNFKPVKTQMPKNIDFNWNKKPGYNRKVRIKPTVKPVVPSHSYTVSPMEPLALSLSVTQSVVP